MALNESRTRTRPCATCKRSKVKCHYVDSLPCERCAKYNLKCYLSDQALNDLGTTTRRPQPLQQIVPQPNLELLPNQALQRPSNWNECVDSRISTLENALESVLSILQTSQSQQQQQMDLLQQQINGSQRLELPRPSNITTVAEIETQLDGYVPTGPYDCDDVRISEILTKDDAVELFETFIKNFVAQLFGYDVRALDVHQLWQTSPLLLLSICTVSCSHHPKLASKFEVLKRNLDFYASQSLIREVPADQVENVILGLIIGALWLESGQMFISVAIQLARINRLDQPSFDASSHNISSLHRLWYLLYIVDGNQNLTFHKSPSIYKRSETLLQNSRKNVIDKMPNPQVRKVLNENHNSKDKVVNNRQLELLNEVECRKMPISEISLSELRLLGQVEYHMAMESVFTNNQTSTLQYDKSLEASMALLHPSNFGVPWESNLKLDKWMISWTITLQNIDFQSDSWCLKSTLLYYNFARMHINAEALLASAKSTTFDGARKDLVNVWHSSKKSEPVNDDIEKFIDASFEISRSAAHSLIKLATDDDDIRGIIQFLPLHVHIMLYYASLVLLNPADVSVHGNKPGHKTIATRYKAVTKLRKQLLRTTFSDPRFKSKLIESFTQLLHIYKEKCSIIFSGQHDDKERARFQEIFENDSSQTEPQKPRFILAWPGTNPGHP
ncbi:LANO_0G13388g1_1 [Lachancea nothofagi CBS 11611]|uniref:LANO_0G13388g1_1 n=1 Tax=Lachancea nothofagi CBS 11611 TaxID=1266666 RepID=A0A1G4KJY5_9SACH|nr:LANO_0G13388g1_1 [Lachancea nothofagi CBS 11611]